MFKKKIIFIFLIATGICLSGCAETIPLSPENAKRIHTVYINPTVIVPKEMYYLGSGIGFLFGPIGGAIEAVANLSPGERLALFAKQHGIDIGQIVQHEFVQELQRNTPFKLVNTSNADATMNVDIKMFGLSIPTTFSSGVKPVIDVQANMVDRQHQIIWQNSDSVLPLSPGMPEHTTDEIHKNPQLLQEIWSAAAKRSVSSIVKTLSFGRK